MSTETGSQNPTPDADVEQSVVVHAPTVAAHAAILDATGIVANIELVDADAPPTREGATVRLLSETEARSVVIGAHWDGTIFTSPPPTRVEPPEDTVTVTRAVFDALVEMIVNHSPATVKAALDAGAITPAQADALK